MPLLDLSFSLAFVLLAPIRFILIFMSLGERQEVVLSLTELSSNFSSSLVLIRTLGFDTIINNSHISVANAMFIPHISSVC